MILKNVSLTIFALLVFALEQLVGVPFFFFAVILWWSQSQTPVVRQGMLAIAGLMVAIAYQLPLAGGWLLLVMLALLWQPVQNIIRNDILRLVLLSAIGAVIVGVGSGFHWTSLALVSLMISAVVTIIFGQVAFFMSISTGRLKLTPSVRLVPQKQR